MAQTVAEPPIVDELLWMEPARATQALSWARAATQRSTVALQSSPCFKPLLDELTELNRTAGPVADIGLAGRYAVRLRRTAEYPKGLLQTGYLLAEGLGPWRTVLDVGELGRSEGKDFELQWNSSACLPPARARCLLSLHEAGGDEGELREFDLMAGEFVRAGFALPSSRTVAAWFDADTLLLGHTLGDAPKTMTGWPAQAVLWRRGTPVEEARPVLRLDPTHALFMMVPTGMLGQAVVAQALDYSTFVLHQVRADGTTRKLPLPAKLRMSFGANAMHVFAQLAAPVHLSGKTVPADSVVAVPLDANGDTAEEVVEVVYAAQPGEVVDSTSPFKATRDAVALLVRNGLSSRVDTARRDASGWRLRTLLPPRLGEAPRVVDTSPDADNLVVMRSGFLVPPVQELLDLDGRRTPLIAEASAMDTSGVQVQGCEARSPDGQAIQFFLIAPRQRKHGPTPTLMTGYGAFGVALNPAYFNAGFEGARYGGATLKLWFERGGALVVPAIRGGGEGGAAWHQAAMRGKRQTSYDDFHAVAQSLIDSGFTEPRCLGVFGLSNGGLLAAVAGTQRPDLYGAIVSDVPLADMLRFPEMGMGAAWIDEYGDPNDPEAAQWLRSYSPVHAVKRGVHYPAFLVTVATNDDKVGPGHARKLAHRLMDVGAPVQYLEIETGGHGVSDPMQRPDMMAMRILFLIERLMVAPESHEP
jgi:prolyl oligopeptidase